MSSLSYVFDQKKSLIVGATLTENRKLSSFAADRRTCVHGGTASFHLSVKLCDAHFVLSHLLIGATPVPLGELISTVVIYDSPTRAEILVSVCETRT